MPWQNLLFVAISPFVLIALIATAVSGFGTVLLEARYWADHQHELGHMTENVARLVPVGIALAASAIVFVGAIILSTVGRSSPRRDRAASARH